MDSELCTSILVSRNDSPVGRTMSQCLLKVGHRSDIHLSRISGIPIVWSKDSECHCIGKCHCVEGVSVAESVAEALLADNS